MPVVPSCLLEPAWVEFSSLLAERRGEQPEFHPGHPLGCHRRRIPGRVVFEHVVTALVHGSGYERIASPGCSDRTIRRRLAEWAALGLGEALHAAALRAYDQVIGLELADVPVDRRRGGLKRSVATEGYGIPLRIASAGANRHDSPLLAPTGRPPAGSPAASCPGIAPATWTAVMTASPPVSCWMSWASTARSPARHPGSDPGQAPAGSSSAPTHG